MADPFCSEECEPEEVISAGGCLPGETGPPPGPSGCTTVENCVDPETGEPTPLTVTIANPAVQVDNEYICVDGNWVLVVFVDGVETSQTDTGILCTEPKPADFEPVEECREDTIWTVFYQINADGTTVEINAIDTGNPCDATAICDCITAAIEAIPDPIVSAPCFTCITVDGEFIQGLATTNGWFVQTAVGLELVTGVVVIPDECDPGCEPACCASDCGDATVTECEECECPDPVDIAVALGGI